MVDDLPALEKDIAKKSKKDQDANRKPSAFQGFPGNPYKKNGNDQKDKQINGNILYEENSDYEKYI